MKCVLLLPRRVPTGALFVCYTDEKISPIHYCVVRFALLNLYQESDPKEKDIMTTMGMTLWSAGGTDSN